MTMEENGRKKGAVVGPMRCGEEAKKERTVAVTKALRNWHQYGESRRDSLILRIDCVDVVPTNLLADAAPQHVAPIVGSFFGKGRLICLCSHSGRVDTHSN